MKTLLKPTRIALAVAALALPFTATANQSLNTAGYAGTIGGVVNEGSIHSSSFNPAGNNLLLKKEEKMRFGYLSNLGGYVEIGESDDLDKKVDAMVDDLDAIDDFNVGGKAYLVHRYGNLGNSEADYYEAIAKEFNTTIIPDLEKGGQFRAGGQLQVPLTPFLLRSSSARGTFSLNASASTQIKSAFLGDKFGVRTTFKDASGNSLGAIDIDMATAAAAYNDIKAKVTSGINNTGDIDDIKTILQGSGILTPQNIAAIEEIKINVNDIVDGDTDYSFTTNSGLDVKAAVVAHFGLGYGTNLTEWLELNDEHGQLETGVRLNLYNVEAGRKFVSLQAEANSNDDSSASDNLTEDFLDNTETTMGVGLDLGFLWHADNYQAGITFYNLNEPSFDYPDLSKVLDANDSYDSETLDALYGLQTAGKTKVADSVTLTRHAVIEGAYFSKSRNWMLQGSYTLGTATNFVGDEFQNLHLSAGYYPKTAWIPGLRAGYSQNMKGSELSKIHAGATFYGIMHLDLAVSPDTSSFDDSDIPRYVAFSLGFEEKF
ncbi:conjugal transfer protein TraF [Marinospirillum insulare]|uniref:Plasmid transfer operon, TraF, protein n=1 Tax=Marinospirillum insulare TaxID=217169 RepID=A0ABQ6A182_9GAMM|nr:conjugal transfer protein TraF [Marinospirillum insulare]GLR64681.1 hypothetical protein GCM10007878_21190 [Marinospirillum insulare]